jgi:DNA helicase II / ATP-dependent DNA helicase PcrA
MSDHPKNDPQPEIQPSRLDRILQSWHDRLRPGQREIADWTSGRLAVSAVPGAGKSTGMAVAAAIAIARHELHAGKQLVIVTFTRSAAANLKQKIRRYLKEFNLPTAGFTVQTLHGLAWSIARSAPSVSGLSSDTVLMTLNQGHRLVRSTVEQWILEHPELFQRLVEGQSFDGEETERLRRQSVLRTEVLPALALTVIQEAKKSGLKPDDVMALQARSPDEYSVLEISAGLYQQYQQQLRSRNWIDYDEMMLAALRVLQNEGCLTQWRSKVFAVFEDEAQDSSPLQTQLLEILSTNPVTNIQNFIRVGDPNQAINSTFTPADPIFFRNFCDRCATENNLAEMTQAGRSSTIIIDAANFVLDWVNTRAANDFKSPPFRRQYILPVNPGDPQSNGNPAPEGTGLEIIIPNDTYQTVQRMGDRIRQLWNHTPETSIAILVRTNDQGRFVANELRRLYENTIPIFEVGEQERRSHIPAEIMAMLQFCDRPHSPDYLKAALSVLATHKRIPQQDLNTLVIEPEQFLYPSSIAPEQSEATRSASRVCRSLLKSRIELPLYQLIPFCAYALDYDQGELATADKLADRLFQQMAQQAQDTSLGEMLGILGEIVNSEQFEPVSGDDEDDDRYTRNGQVTVITMHKAKGLDWDAVFIPFLHEAMIPGKLYVPQPAQFLGGFTLSEVARAQIRSYIHGDELPDLITAWTRAEELKQAEEYRLLYVAMTRAKRLLWMSAANRAPFMWSKPEGLSDRPACPVIPALLQRFNPNRS